MKRAYACTALLLVAAIAPAAFAGGDGNGCLIALDGSTDVRNLSYGVRTVAPANREQVAKVLFTCQVGRLSGLTIRLAPGQEAETRLILTGTPEHTVALISQDEMLSDWVRLSSSRLDAQTTIVTVSISAPGSVRTGRKFFGQLSLAPERSNLDIPVTLEIVGEEPLFRDEFDEFDVDPVIGQFSMADGAQWVPFPSLPGFDD